MHDDYDTPEQLTPMQIGARLQAHKALLVALIDDASRLSINYQRELDSGALGEEAVAEVGTCLAIELVLVEQFGEVLERFEDSFESVLYHR